MNHLLHPELIQSLPFTGGLVAHTLNEHAAATMADDPALDPPISVVIRAFNEAPKLELLLQDVSKQVVGSAVEVIIVDNESTDNTGAVANEYGAKIVTIPRGEFTYPRSMNLGMEAASHNAVFLTVAHARLATTHTLHAAARHFTRGNVGGVFAARAPLPSEAASGTERALVGLSAWQLLRSPHRVKRAGMGVMGAVGAMFSKTAWEKLGRFDERYETGGEDTVLARDMLAAGFDIMQDSAAIVHHAHGLGLIATIKEVAHFAQVLRAPRKLHGEVKARRQARFNG